MERIIFTFSSGKKFNFLCNWTVEIQVFKYTCSYRTRKNGNDTSSTFRSVLTLMNNYCISSIGPLSLLRVQPPYLSFFTQVVQCTLISGRKAIYYPPTSLPTKKTIPLSPCQRFIDPRKFFFDNLPLKFIYNSSSIEIVALLNFSEGKKAY